MSCHYCLDPGPMSTILCSTSPSLTPSSPLSRCPWRPAGGSSLRRGWGFLPLVVLDLSVVVIITIVMIKIDRIDRSGSDNQSSVVCKKGIQYVPNERIHPCDDLTGMRPLILREGVKKNRLFLGKSPKLWVGGGQES